MRLYVPKTKVPKTMMANLVISNIKKDMRLTLHVEQNRVIAMKYRLERGEYSNPKEITTEIEAIEHNNAIFEDVCKTIANGLDKAFIAKEPIRNGKITLCSSCNHRVHSKYNYCHWCGQKLAKVKAAVPRE